MWKDFFYYSKKEQRGLILLSCITLIVVGFTSYSLLQPASQPPLASPTLVACYDSFRTSVRLQQEKRFKHRYPTRAKHPVRLSRFDPNRADSIQLLEEGLSPYVVYSILQYRRKGGVFRTPKALSKIYGMKKQDMQRIAAYIQIDSSFQIHRDTSRWKKYKRDTLLYYKYPTLRQLALNRVDTAELKKVPGIGSGLAKMIVAYRRRLGGFFTVQQLREINYMPDSLLKWFHIEQPPLPVLKVNHFSLERLRSHPYLNFYQAKVIVTYRRKKGVLKNSHQLSLYEEFTAKDLERLSPYLSFE